MGKGRGMKNAAKRKPAEEPLVNEFAAAHGIFERNMRFVINRGGTAIDRWKREGLLSDTQQAAILHCQRLWHVIDRGPRLVANLDRTVFGSHGEGHPREVEARDDLHRIKSGFESKWWEVFENVCRNDEPAGVAGSRLANDNRSATTAARIVVCMIADAIHMRERLSY